MPEPRSTSEPDAEVRRLLAQARHDEPLPDAVAQRLDRVLSDLRASTAQPASETGAAPSADADRSPGLASLHALRGRRRAATQLLVAAAAVLVVAVGIGHLVRDGDLTSSSDSGSGSTGTVSRSDADAAGGGRAASTPGAGLGASPGSSYAQLVPSLPLPLTSTGFEQDARAAVVTARGLRRPLRGDAPLTTALAAPPSGWTCSPAGSTAAYGPGTLLPATYDGTAVVLAVRPATGDSQPVQVLACADAGVIRSGAVDLHDLHDLPR